MPNMNTKVLLVLILSVACIGGSFAGRRHRTPLEKYVYDNESFEYTVLASARADAYTVYVSFTLQLPKQIFVNHPFFWYYAFTVRSILSCDAETLTNGVVTETNRIKLIFSADKCQHVSLNFFLQVLNLTSQTWLSSVESSRPVWWHYLTICVPDNVSYIISGPTRVRDETILKRS